MLFQSYVVSFIMSQEKVESVESGKSETVIKKKFPKAVPFILSNVFFERICTGGIFAILALFINQKLHFDANLSTALFHVNEFILYFFSIIGAIIADSWLGLFKTISSMTLLLSAAAGLIAIASIDDLGLPIKLLSLVGLSVFVIASGGIKSNQNVFGGNQFHLPDDEKQLNQYFSMQYFTLKCGLLMGQILIPILRNDVQCFGMTDCYPLAFGFPAALMFLSFFILLSGKSFYVHVPPTDNMLVKVCCCIKTGISQRYVNRNKLLKAHWLDYAVDEYGEKLVLETKMVLNVLTMFLPLPIFWALYTQVNSSFVFQATQMNGDIGWYTIKPDQMAMPITLFIIVLIPIFEKFLYPIVANFGIKTPLHKMACGLICSAISFVFASVIELEIQMHEIHMLWLIPQYLVMAMAEVLLWVATVSFAFTQAPNSMKSVMTAFVYLTIAGGSLIIIVIKGTNFIEAQFEEFLFYTILMIINTIFFILLAKNYKYVT